MTDILQSYIVIEIDVEEKTNLKKVYSTFTQFINNNYCTNYTNIVLQLYEKI